MIGKICLVLVVAAVVAGICYLVAALWSLNALKAGLVVWAVLAALGFRFFGRER